MRQLSLSLWHKFWHDSWAKAWGYAKLTVGSVGAGVPLLGGVLNDGGVKSAIDAMHLNPRIMLGLAILGVITIFSAPHHDA